MFSLEVCNASIGKLVVHCSAAIALDKLLSGNEPLTWRAAIGRTILKSATSLVAGVALMHIPNLHPLALLGLGSALGIAGAQAVEAMIRRFGGGHGGGK